MKGVLHLMLQLHQNVRRKRCCKNKCFKNKSPSVRTKILKKRKYIQQMNKKLNVQMKLDLVKVTIAKWVVF